MPAPPCAARSAPRAKVSAGNLRAALLTGGAPAAAAPRNDLALSWGELHYLPPVSWGEVVAGALAGAVAGGSVSVMASARIAEGAEVGRLRADSRRRVGTVLAEYRVRLKLVEARGASGGPAEGFVTYEPGDQVFQARLLLDAGSDLSPRRARKLRDALVRLFGELRVLEAEELPSGSPSDPLVAATWMAAELNKRPELAMSGGVLDAAARDRGNADRWQQVWEEVRAVESAVQGRR